MERPLSRRKWIKGAIVAASLMPLSRCARLETRWQPAVSSAASRGVGFLASLNDSELDLLPEYRGANVYWLFHDNYLAAKVLKASHPELAGRIELAMRRFGVARSGKIEIVFDEAEKPLPFRRYKLVEVREIGGKHIKTEIVEAEPIDNWEQYADLLLLAGIALGHHEPERARRHFEAAVAMWDGHGFADLAARSSGQYSTYKLALGLIAAAKLRRRSAIEAAVLQKLLAQQGDDGGWITDYDAAERRLGVANVETTSLAVLALGGYGS